MAVRCIALALALAGCWTKDPATAPPQPPPQDRVAVVRSPKPSADAFTDAMSMLERFRDDICACSDTPCIEQVTKEISKWGETMAKQADPARKPTPEETRRMTEISRQLTECMSRAMSAGPPTP